MTPSGLRRLLADLPDSTADHPIDAGLLGEYALLERERGPGAVAEVYPRVAMHLRAGCQRCQDLLTDLDVLARRSSELRGDVPASRAPAGQPGSPREEASDEPSTPTVPEPLEIAEAIALARAVEAERDAMRAPLRPDRFGTVDPRRQAARRRSLLLVEAALIRQRLAVRRLFLDRASAFLLPAAPSSAPPEDRRPPGRLPNPKARLMLDDFANQVDDLRRLAGRVGRLTADLRRLGDDPRGPARSQSEALVERGLGLTREALDVDRRLVRLQGPLAGMLQ